MMKGILAFLLLALCIFAVAHYGSAPGKIVSPASIKTYKNIPGVTEEEIAAIEALKAAGHTFSYGAMRSTEAYIRPGSSYAGFAAEFCRLLSGLFGIRFVLNLYEWDELLHRLETRSLDFTGELTPTKERKRKYSMSLPIAQRQLRLFTLASADRIRTEADVKGRIIGALAGSSNLDSIARIYRLPFERKDIDNFRMAARMIRNGEIDAFVAETNADPFFEDDDFIRSAIFFPMVYEPVTLTTANPALAPVISVVSKYIAAGGIDRLYEIYKQQEFDYAKHKLHRSFTSEEQAYLLDMRRRKAAVRVAFEHYNYPVTFYNKQEEAFQGIAVDVLAEISKLTSIHFVAATTQDSAWPEIFEQAKAGDIPMVAQLLRSEARREHFIWSEVPYASSYYAIMSQAEYPDLAPYQIARAPVSMMTQSGHADIYHELFPNNDNIQECGAMNDCLDALEKGDIKLLMASEYVLLTQTHYRQKPGLKINLKLAAPMESYFGFHKDERILCSIVDKAQQYVQTDVIETAWTSRVFDYSQNLTEKLIIFAGILSVLLLTTVLLLVKNILLGRKLKNMANKDDLTGLLNRRHFMELALMLHEQSLRTGNEAFIVIFDLDHFKAINDKHGHFAGDRVLQESARRVKSLIRSYDLFGRFGGEEFILLMPDIYTTNALQVAERIRRALCSSPVDFEGRAIPVAASFGIARAAPVHDLDTAIRCADEALYRAKHEGRNRVVLHRQDR